MPAQRILFIVPVLKRAGAECQLVALVNGLPVDKFEKHLLSYRPGDDLKNDLDNKSVTLHEFDRKGRLDIGIARKIGKVIDTHQIDVLHCTLQNAMLYGWLARFFASRNPAIVAVVHTTKNPDLKHDVADWVFYRPLFKRCAQIWFVSTKQAQHWIEKMPFMKERHRTIHNGIDLREFDPAVFAAAGQALRNELGIAPTEVVLSCVAGFRPEKLHAVMLEAFAQLQQEDFHGRLLLAGTGPTEIAIRQQVAELGLQDKVIFLGALADVRPVLAAADIKLLVSAAETFSMAMLEAMAMNLPVITTSVGGAAEAIESGSNGFLVRPDDVQALTTKLRLLAQDADLRKSMGTLARRTVVERFSLEKMVMRSTSALNELAATKKLAG